MRYFSLVALFSITVFLGIEKYQIFKFKDSNYDTFINKIIPILPTNKVLFCSDNVWLGLHERAIVIPTHRFFSEISTVNKDLTVEQFVKEHSIQYIVADKEMISWPWFKEALPEYFSNHCRCIGEVKDDFYNFSDFLSKRSPNPLVTRIYEVTK